MMKKALDAGSTGQDGPSPVEFARKKGYEVHSVKYRQLLFNTDRLDHPTHVGLDKRMSEIAYAPRDRIPDGMLIRVVSVDPDTNRASEDRHRYRMTMALKECASSVAAAVTPCCYRKGRNGFISER